MVGHFAAPVLHVAADVVKELDGGDALHGLWNLFTKCKDSIHDGNRLENISWRLWFREMSRGPVSTPIKEKTPGFPFPVVTEKLHPNTCMDTYRPASPTSPSQETDPSSGSGISPLGAHVLRSPSSIGYIICSIADKAGLPLERKPGPLKAQVPTISAPVPESTASSSSQPRTIAVISAPGSLAVHGSDAVYPRVVVVNPTPHPTPPATPQVGPAARREQQEDVERPVSPVAALPPSVSAKPVEPAPHAVQASDEAVPHPPSGPNTRRSPDRPKPTPLANPVERDRRFFLPLSSPVDDSGSSGDNGSVLALLATPEDRVAPPSPLSNVPDASASRPEPTREDSSDPHAGTSVVSQSSVISKASTTASRKGHAAGKRPTAATSKPRRSHGGHARTGLVRKHSTGANAGKTSLVAGAIRRSSSTASGVGDVSILRALTSMPPPAAPPADKDKKRPPPVQTDVPASKVSAGPTSAKSPKGKGKVPPSPVVKAGARGKNGYAKGKKFTSRGLTRTKSLVHEPEEESDESEDFEEVVNAGDEDEDDGWDDLSAEELAAQAAREREAAKERAREEEKQRMREYFKKRPASEYANLGRTKSTGLLSQLLNPDPNIFPAEHPYRQGLSTDNLAQLSYAHLQQQQSPYRRTQSSLATQLGPMTTLQPRAPFQPQDHPPLQVERQTQPARAAVPAGLSAAPARVTAGPAAAATRTPAISRTSSLAAIGGAAPSLKITKSSAALPAMETFNAAGSSVAVRATTAMAAASLAKANLTVDRSNSKSSVPSAQVQSPTTSQPSQAQAQPPAQAKKPSPGGSGGYRPRGAPAEADLETDSEDESSVDNGIQVARSVVNQKLAALGSRPTPKAPAPSPSSSHAAPRGPPNPNQLPTNPPPPRPRSEPQIQDQPLPAAREAMLPSNASASTLVGGTAPIPLVFPYHLPLAPPPSSPGTTRKRMVATELSESLRRGLLREHEVNRQPPPRRRGLLSTAGTLRPFTTLDQPRRTPEEEAAHRRRQQHLDRKRSNADDYHSHGW